MLPRKQDTRPRPRRSFSRVETDQELLDRIRRSGGSTEPLFGETLDRMAVRLGTPRLVIWVDDPP